MATRNRSHLTEGRSTWSRRRRTLAAALGVSFLVVGVDQGALPSPQAGAAGTIWVTTTSQEVDTDDLCSLQEAIFAANFDAAKAIDPFNLNGPLIDTGCAEGNGPDTIVLAAGAVYQVSGIVQNQFSVAGLTANPDVRSTITIEGNGARLELVGSLDLRAFVVNRAPGEVKHDEEPADADGNLTIRNLHIKGFRAQGGDGDDGGGGGLGAGGAIYVRNGALTVENVTFEGNSATGGAGAWSDGTPGGGGGGGLGGNAGGNLATADHHGGGGGGGARGAGGDGSASGGGGGGTANNGVGGGSTVGGTGGFNCGGRGGRFAGDNGSGGSSTFNGSPGFCTGGGGGGGAAGPSTQTDGGATSDNGGSGGAGNYGGGGGGGGSPTTAGNDGGDGGNGGFGGGGGAAGTGFTTPENGDGGDGGFGGGAGAGLAEGSPGYFGGDAGAGAGGGGGGLGGGIFNDRGDVTILNSTFTGNTATGGVRGSTFADGGIGAGGAVFSYGGSTRVYNSTIDGNSAVSNNSVTGASGGGLYVFGNDFVPTTTFFLRNTIISNNGAWSCEVNTGGLVPSVSTAGSGNLIEANATGDRRCPGVVSIADPGLGALALNSPGNTPTMAITMASPAFNTGDNGTCLATDQRGVARPQGAGCDIGAYELEVADVSITKTADSEEVIAGTALSYTIRVYNNGPGTARDVVVTDVLPAGLTYAADTAITSPAGGCTVVGQTVTCALVDIPAFTEAVFKIKVNVDVSYVAAETDGTRTLTNTATVTSEADPNLTNNSSTEISFVTDEADLEVHKFIEPAGPLMAGQTFIYTILVDNMGPSTARNVVIRDTFLSHPDVTVQSCAFSVSQGGGAITQFTCTTGNLVSTQFGTDIATMRTNFLVPFGTYDTDPDPMVENIEVQGRLRASFRLVMNNAGSTTNTVRVASNTPDPYSPNNFSVVNANVVPAADLAITKTAAPEPVNAGDLLTYTLTVNNNGPSVAFNTVVKDYLPSWVSVVSVTSTGNTCTTGVPGDAAQPLTCNLGTMVHREGRPLSGAGSVPDNSCEPPTPADGELCAPETITVVVRVKPDTPNGTLLFNQAVVSSDVADPINSNNRVSRLTTVVGSADLAITKVGLGPYHWISGEERTYRIDVDNLGPSLAKDVVVIDQLVDGVEFVSAYLGSGQGAIPAPCTVSSDNRMECRLGDIAAADGITSLFVRVKIRADVPDGTIVSNTATVSSDTPDAIPGNNSDTDDEEMTIEADLAVVITTESNFFPDPLLYVIGEGVVAEQLLQEFTVTATNHGPSDAQKVLVTVELPPVEVGYYIFDDGGCTKIDQILACPIGTLAAGESWTFHYMFRIFEDMLFVTTSANIDVDDDLDLVPNNRDLCDGTPLGTAVDVDGCPAPDADGDLIVDASDACPSTPIGTTVDTTGCPAPDADADGVRDAIDLCPGTPPGTPVNLDGCPDADQDQVVDSEDECPGTEPNRTVTLIGCPLDPNLENNWFTKTLVDADGTLPDTGANSGWMTSLGASLLLGGVGLVIFSRRRRRLPAI